MLFVPADEKFLGILGQQDGGEQLAGQWQDSHFDEDAGWWANVQLCGATFALAVGLALSGYSTTAAASVFNQHQDDPAASLINQPAVQEEYWQNPTPPVNWPQPSLFTDDDVHPTFVQVFGPDDGDWHSLVWPVQDSNFVRLPFLEPDESPQFTAATAVVDDQSPSVPQPTPQEQPWTLLFFLDDGSAVHVFRADEDFWAPQIPPQNWPQPQQPFAAPDDDQEVPEFVSAEDPLWLQLTPPVPASLIWPQPFLFEQNESTNLVAFTAEEHNWPIPVPVAASLQWPQQFQFEQNEDAGNLALPAFEETLWQNWVPPVPASLALLQQWQFEQNEPAGSLFFLRDEDYWQNQVAPIYWLHKQPFVFDESVGQVSAAVLDEDFWPQFAMPSVPPVPPSMFLVFPYQPDPEEIPAGSLVPPVPPPPCMPPFGYDPDTTINYFGGNAKPTAVLFCRTCMSGRPLLVRADYAIWCQDCCRFVSKQETYMGTTRAPGKFKAIF